MKTLPAPGQAQPLPAKWVIKVTPENVNDLYKWAKKKFNRGEAIIVGCYVDYHGDVYDKIETWATEITTEQFRELTQEPKLPDNWADIMNIHQRLEMLEEHDLAAALKAKHPDIWPVDYAAIVLEKAVAWVQSDDDSEYGASCELHRAVRNYLTNQK